MEYIDNLEDATRWISEGKTAVMGLYITKDGDWYRTVRGSNQTFQETEPIPSPISGLLCIAYTAHTFALLSSLRFYTVDLKSGAVANGPRVKITTNPITVTAVIQAQPQLPLPKPLPPVPRPILPLKLRYSITISPLPDALYVPFGYLDQYGILYDREKRKIPESLHGYEEEKMASIPPKLPHGIRTLNSLYLIPEMIRDLNTFLDNTLPRVYAALSMPELAGIATPPLTPLQRSIIRLLEPGNVIEVAEIVNVIECDFLTARRPREVDICRQVISERMVVLASESKMDSGGATGKIVFTDELKPMVKQRAQKAGYIPMTASQQNIEQLLSTVANASDIICSPAVSRLLKMGLESINTRDAL